MRLSPGSSVGPYRILSSLGAGGMGEVYRAEHVRLGREVAVKVLHEVTSDNPEYKSRFEREARVLASLNHPNIATLHGLEEVGDSTLLEMELVPGETLAERLERGPLSAMDALPIFKQIALALEAAHERGIIHRDLKPSNVKVTPEGRVKVLDFGLAKAFESERPESSSNAAMFTTTTQRGLILGTAAYMSPEHVRGKVLDRRTDIWAFGCMFFEVLSGKPPFASETVSDTLAAVLREEPEWRAISHAPVAVQRLIKRCLKKDPQTRLHDIADAGLEIEDALAESAPIVFPMPGRDPWRVRKNVAFILAAAAAIVAAVLAGAIWFATRPVVVPDGPTSRLTVAIPPTQHVERGGLAPLTISPDGTRLVYAAVEGTGRTQLFMRALDRFDSTPVPGTEGASAPFFSPDGRWIGFYANGALQRISIDGGAALKIADAPSVWSATWCQDDTIVFAASATAGGLWRVNSSGGAPERLTTVDADNGEIQHAFPQRLPNGDVLFGVFTDRGWHLASVSPAESTKTVRALGQPGSGGAGVRYLSTGHVLYASGGGLVAVPFDPTRGITGSPIPILERPEVDPSGSAAFAVADSGTLVYVPRPSAIPMRSLVMVDAGGRATLVSETRAAYSHPRLSRDGKRLAVAIETETGSDIWVYDLERRSRTRLTSGGVNRFPIWNADDRRVTFQASRPGGVSLYTRNADGTGDAEPLIQATDQSALSRSLVGLLPGSMPLFTAANPHFPMSWSFDGANLAFDERKPSAERDIWVLSKDGTPSTFLVTPFDEFAPAFSPDGKWLAYVSDESGRNEVYVQPFPGPGGKWPISTEGGTEPAWSADGRQLFFRRGAALFAVPVSTSPDFKAGVPQFVFETQYEVVDGARNYDVVPEKSEKPSFVAVRSEGAAETDQFNVVLNWFTELRARR